MLLAKGSPKLGKLGCFNKRIVGGRGATVIRYIAG
jgi:hypothetical protein